MTDEKQNVLEGFQINWISLQDFVTGEVMWSGNEDYSSSKQEHEVRLPKTIFKHKKLHLVINFSSIDSWDKLKVAQTALYKCVPLEEWVFEFGAVGSDSRNTWWSVIEAAPEAKLMHPDVLSGNILLITKFYDNEQLITTSTIRVYYE